MQIVIPIYGFGVAGGYRVLSELASHWVSYGHRVTMLAHFSSQEPYFPTSAEILWLDDNGHQMPSGHANAVFSPTGAEAARIVLGALRRGLNRYASDADIVLANHSFTVWPVRLSRTRARKFYYIQAYEPDLLLERRGLSGYARRFVSYSGYFAGLKHIVNAQIYRRYKAIRAEHVVPPGIDLSIMYPSSSRQPSQDGRTVVGCIGRREKWKGTEVILDAYDEMLRRGYSVELRVAFGNIPADRPPALNRTVVMPNGDRELGTFYRSLDVMIATGSVQLGAAHYPVMEAMACGIPVVTTGYYPATASNAWIARANDAGAIADAVGEVIARPGESFSRAEQARLLMEQFSWPLVADSMLRIFSAS